MDAKQGARERLVTAEADLLALSRRIHARPELAFEEECAAGWLADALDAAGFRVRRGICDVPTAFVATAGSGPLHVAICAEYDALPDIGHACGHNLIAAIAVGAGLAAAHVADDARPHRQRGRDARRGEAAAARSCCSSAARSPACTRR